MPFSFTTAFTNALKNSTILLFLMICQFRVEASVYKTVTTCNIGAFHTLIDLVDQRPLSEVLPEITAAIDLRLLRFEKDGQVQILMTMSPKHDFRGSYKRSAYISTRTVHPYSVKVTHRAPKQYLGALADYGFAFTWATLPLWSGAGVSAAAVLLEPSKTAAVGGLALGAFLGLGLKGAEKIFSAYVTILLRDSGSSSFPEFPSWSDAE